jgi:hypothetical protein
MGIQMVGYKMIYKSVIYNLISICTYSEWDSENKTYVLKEIEAVYIDENNRLTTVKDNVEEFQFIAK